MRYNHELSLDLARYYFPGSDEENKRLYPLVVNGEKQAYQDMINNNIPLALLMVKNFFRQRPQLGYLQDDLIAEAFLHLVKSIDAFTKQNEPSDKEPGGYITRSIQHGLQRAAEQVPLIRIPRGNFTDPPVVIGDWNFDKIAGIDTNILELNDLIESCCKTDLEQKLVALRNQGYFFSEIANLLKTPLSTLEWIMNSIQKRVMKKLKE